MELYKSDNLIITTAPKQPSVICTWTKNTAELTFDEYFDEYIMILHLVMELKIFGIISDERDLRFQIERKYLLRFYDIICHFNFSALRSFAYVKHEEFVADFRKELERPHRLPIYLEACFSDLNEALKWSKTAIMVEKTANQYDEEPEP